MKTPPQLDFLWSPDPKMQMQAEELLFGLLPLLDIETELLEWEADDNQLPYYLRGTKGPALYVNQRRIKSFSQPGQSSREIRKEIQTLASKKKAWIPRAFLLMLKDFGFSLAIGLFPKCPFCWASYMSVLASWGLPVIPYKPWILIVLIVLLWVNLAILTRSALLRKNFLPLALNITGSIAVILGLRVLEAPAMTSIGLVLILISSMLNTNIGSHFRARRLKFGF